MKDKVPERFRFGYVIGSGMGPRVGADGKGTGEGAVKKRSLCVASPFSLARLLSLTDRAFVAQPGSARRGRIGKGVRQEEVCGRSAEEGVERGQELLQIGAQEASTALIRFPFLVPVARKCISWLSFSDSRYRSRCKSYRCIRKAEPTDPLPST